MITDIFVCTFWKDADWLSFCLRSVAKYASGFRQTIVVCPERDKDVIGAVTSTFPFVELRTFDEEADGHMHQTLVKSSCDQYSDADQFLMLDSDCVFTHPVTPRSFMTDGKPDWHVAHYDDPVAEWKGGRLPWKEITDRAIGIECMMETMRRFPFLIPSWLFSGLRAWIKLNHGVPFEQYVREAKPLGRAWHGYSEFCALGAYAWLAKDDAFHWIDIGKEEEKPRFVKQFWSHSQITAEERAELEEITA